MKRDLAYTVWLMLVAAVVLIGVVILATAAKAQRSDRFVAPNPAGAFTHVPPGMADPYPHECCHGRDCMPWPVEDVIPNGDGTYKIPSLGVTVKRGQVRPLTKAMSDLAIALNGEATPYHLCVRRDPVSGDVVQPVTVHCFFAGDGM